MPGADQIDLHLGASTWLELMARHRSLAERVDEVRSIVDAVTAGGFQEILWETGGRVTRSRALITLEDGKTIGWLGWYLRLPIPGRKRRIRYQPYE
jgi:hypothetical protein